MLRFSDFNGLVYYEICTEKLSMISVKVTIYCPTGQKKEVITLKTRRFFVCKSLKSSMPLLSTSFSRTQRKRLRSRPASLPAGRPSRLVLRALVACGLFSSFMWNAVCQLLPALVGISLSPTVFLVEETRGLTGCNRPKTTISLEICKRKTGKLVDLPKSGAPPPSAPWFASDACHSWDLAFTATAL